MVRFQTGAFLALAKVLGEARQEAVGKSDNSLLDNDTRKGNIKSLESWIKALDELGLRLTKLQVNRVIQTLGKEEVTYREIGPLYHEIAERLSDECSLLHFMALSDTERDLLE